MRGESLGTRLPPTRAVSPRSPVRVYTRVMLIMARPLWTAHGRPGDGPGAHAPPESPVVVNLWDAVSRDHRIMAFEVQLQKLVVPVEGHALGRPPRQFLDLLAREVLGQRAEEPPAQRMDQARMHGSPVGVHPAPHDEVREVDDEALLPRKPRPRRKGVALRER